MRVPTGHHRSDCDLRHHQADRRTRNSNTLSHQRRRARTAPLAPDQAPRLGCPCLFGRGDEERPGFPASEVLIEHSHHWVPSGQCAHVGHPCPRAGALNGRVVDEMPPTSRLSSSHTLRPIGEIYRTRPTTALPIAPAVCLDSVGMAPTPPTRRRPNLSENQRPASRRCFSL